MGIGLRGSGRPSVGRARKERRSRTSGFDIALLILVFLLILTVVGGVITRLQTLEAHRADRYSHPSSRLTWSKLVSPMCEHGAVGRSPWLSFGL